MKLLANAVAYLAVTSFAVLPNIAMSAEPAGKRQPVAFWAAVPRVALQELVVQGRWCRAVGRSRWCRQAEQQQAEQQQAEQQQAERPLQGLPRQRPAV